MSRTLHHDDAWSMCVSSSAATQCINKLEDTNIEERSKARAAHCAVNLTERDYIGLSANSLAATTSSSQNNFHLNSYGERECYDARDEEQDMGDTELRLGIGPHHGDVNALLTPQHSVHVVQSLLHQPLHVQNLILKQSEDGLSAQSRHCEDAKAYHSMEFHQSFWPWGPGVAPGRLMIPVPKVSTVPAKRPYMEAIGESQASSRALSTNSNTQVESMQVKSEHNSSVPASSILPRSLKGGGLYTWICNTTMPPLLTSAARQHTNLDENGIVGGATFAKNICAERSLPSPPLLTLSSVPPSTQYNPAPLMTSTSKVATQLSSDDEKALLTPNTQKEETRAPKSPVVGWPPVRSFRKNTLQLTAALGANKETATPSDLQSNEDAIKASESAGEQSKTSVKDTLFVKAKLDGVRICRKVDLTSYNNYDSLKSALQEMFQGFVCNDNAKLDLLHSKNYVLTHEDKDGDWMLVGDVPWRMFVTTVKSLRIMKAADAVGLGEKGFAKLKAKDMN